MKPLHKLTVTLLLDRGQVWMRNGEVTIGKMPAHVARALKRVVGEVFIYPFHSLPHLVGHLEAVKPDVVFNLTEQANGRRDLDAGVTGMLDLMGVRYTGENARTLVLCRDKAVSKLVAERQGFKIPWFAMECADEGKMAVPFPLIIKPRYWDASFMISREALVANRRELVARRRRLLRSAPIELIYEQFIPGRDVYIGIVGKRLMPPRELIFPKASRFSETIFTYRLKHSKAYRLSRGVRSVFLRLPPRQLREFNHLAARTFDALGISAYGRLDLRLTLDGEWYFLEANPNIGLTPFREAQLGIWSDIKYDDLIATIVRQSFEKFPPGFNCVHGG